MHPGSRERGMFMNSFLTVTTMAQALLPSNCSTSLIRSYEIASKKGSACCCLMAPHSGALTETPTTRTTYLVTGEHWTGSPNKSIDQIGKKYPKNVRKLCFRPLWTFVGHFFDIFRTFCRHCGFLGCSTICLLQHLSIPNLKATRFFSVRISS